MKQSDKHEQQLTNLGFVHSLNQLADIHSNEDDAVTVSELISITVKLDLEVKRSHRLREWVVTAQSLEQIVEHLDELD